MSEVEGEIETNRDPEAPIEETLEEVREAQAQEIEAASEETSEEELEVSSEESEEALEDAPNEMAEETPVAEMAEVDGEEALFASAEEEAFELTPSEPDEESEKEFVEDEFVESIIESILFASDKPVSLKSLKDAFVGTTVTRDKIKKTLESLSIEYAGARRGVSLEEVCGGYQLRTKSDNTKFLKRLVKAKPFKLSGPALEVLSIIAYKQPVVKAEVDEIRGVDSGHLVRALMDRGIVNFAGKSELPGRPMQYATTRKFLEIFGLRNINELPTLSEIDEILPDGITEEEDEETLKTVSEDLAEGLLDSYSEGEEELQKITSQLSEINSSSEFFEDEKRRQKEKRDQARADDIREALMVDEKVEEADLKWFRKYEQRLAEQEQEVQAPEPDAEMSDEWSAEAETAPVEDEIDAFLADEESESEGEEIVESMAEETLLADESSEIAVVEATSVDEPTETPVEPSLSSEEDSEKSPVSETEQSFAEAEVAAAILDFERDDDDQDLSH